MDKTETYIKMSAMAYPIIGNKKPEAGDYWYCETDRWDEPAGVYLISPYETDSGYYGPGIAWGNDLGGWDLIHPVYRQDQIQEWVEEDFWKRNQILTWKYSCYYHMQVSGIVPNSIHETYRLGGTSFEKLWLALYMKETHNLIWNGENWKDVKKWISA
jgi:hypothetical protein